ncbi:hypothetical protein [Persicobacter sp. CCB-QB2]|uniref:hypothetical protein n=1 Tax=Persicobacter sp. CCB-QB2 TaxID=1561025 RepID=UPI0006A94B61|nr:hypothetical protein [Persicobacter sp. CCB-QB2]
MINGRIDKGAAGDKKASERHFSNVSPVSRLFQRLDGFRQQVLCPADIDHSLDFFVSFFIKENEKYAYCAIKDDLVVFDTQTFKAINL